MKTLLVIVVVFVLLGVIFAAGKGSFLIAGYNTAGSKEKSKYDEKKLQKCFSFFCFGIAIVVGVMGYIDAEKFAVYIGLPLILLLLVFLFISTCTYCKKRKK